MYFANSVYYHRSHPMFGEYTIDFFNDSLFYSTERNGLFYSIGKWEVSPSKKYIYLRNFPYPDIIEKQVNLDSSFLRDVRDTVVTVKNKNKLMYMELEFVRLKP